MRGRAPAGRRVPRRRARRPGARPRRRGRDLRPRDGRQPGDLAHRRGPDDRRARGAPLWLVRARGAARVHAERRVRARPLGRRRVARAGQAGGPPPARHAGRAPALPVRAQPGVRGVRRGPGGLGAAGQRVAARGRRVTRLVDVPAMVNAHSHAFQRDLRAVAERPGSPGDDFWTWRTEMFRLAGALEPASMRDVAGRVYAEMAAAGYGAVGEFHYVHHRPDGTPYDDPNAMALAVAEAAVAAGLRIVLLPAAYHRNGWDGGADRPPEPGQRRFCDPDVATYLARVDALRAWAGGRAGVRVGVAAHSVRAVPATWLREIADYARAHGLVLHVHAHEQRRELEEC